MPALLNVSDRHARMSGECVEHGELECCLPSSVRKGGCLESGMGRAFACFSEPGSRSASCSSGSGKQANTLPIPGSRQPPYAQRRARRHFQLSTLNSLSAHPRIPVTDVEQGWRDLHTSLMTTSQKLLCQPPKLQRPWISETTMQLADQKHKLWRAWQANATSAAKASYKAANRASKRSASDDFERHWKAQLSPTQHAQRRHPLGL